MNSSLIIVLTFICTTLLVCGAALIMNDAFFRYRSAVNDRLSGMTGHAKEDGNTTLFDFKLLAAATSGHKDTWLSRLKDLLDQAGLRIDYKALLAIAISSAATLALAVYAASGRWWTAPGGLFLGFVIPLVYVNARRNLRMRRISQQLPNVFEAIARMVRAGQTVPAAFQLVADEFKPPIADEFWYCYEQQNLGIPYDVALRELARRLPVMELRILVVALLVQTRSGGNLIELLNSLSTMSRKRIKMQQRIKALTGEARLQAVVLIVLPIMAFVALIFLSPDYAGTLIERPWLLSITVFSELIGALWIRQIVRLEV